MMFCILSQYQFNRITVLVAFIDDTPKIGLSETAVFDAILNNNV